MSWHLQVDEVEVDPRAVIGAKMAALANDANSELLLFKRLAHKNEFETRSTPITYACFEGDPNFRAKCSV